MLFHVFLYVVLYFFSAKKKQQIILIIMINCMYFVCFILLLFRDCLPPNDILDATPSPMQQFYQNKAIFLTGGTGFLGKVIMEKLLRSCHIDTIYVLIRSKKGKDIATRIEDICNDVVSIFLIRINFKKKNF